MKNEAINYQNFCKWRFSRDIPGDNRGGIDNDSPWVNRAMDGLEEHLQKLVAEACQHPPKSRQRRQGLTAVIRLIENSGKLWREHAPDYEDALQQTWLYFARNICEADKGEKYDSARAGVITWLNGVAQMLYDSRRHGHRLVF